MVGAGRWTSPGGRAYADSLAAAVGDQAAALRELAARAGRLDADAAAVFQISLPGLLTGAETAVSEVTAALARPAAGTPAATAARACPTSRPAPPTSAEITADFDRAASAASWIRSAGKTRECGRPSR